MELTSSLLSLAGTIVVAGIAAFVAFLAGRRLSIAKLKLPFIDFELMEREKPDRFQALTMIIQEAQYAQIEELEELARTKNADLLIYFGWHIVCDTYLSRFSNYPSDKSLDANIVELGAQNAEFIQIYRTTYERNVLGGGAVRVDPKYALNYFSRALSLAERIDGSARNEHGPRINKLLTQVAKHHLDDQPQ